MPIDGSYIHTRQTCHGYFQACGWQFLPAKTGTATKPGCSAGTLISVTQLVEVIWKACQIRVSPELTGLPFFVIFFRAAADQPDLQHSATPFLPRAPCRQTTGHWR
jgi:hypothetical protein